jgi:hypothetical protein
MPAPPPKPGPTTPQPSRPAPTKPTGRPTDPPPRTCELCGGAVLERHCKIVCLNCGYQRDCSDP